MSSNEFVEMMVLDGCFILEFFHMYLTKTGFNAIREGWISRFIELDMMILENQIPFVIIETLLGSPFDPLAWKPIASILTRKEIPIRVPSHPQKIHHLLHLCLFYGVGTRTCTTQTQHAASEPNHPRLFDRTKAIPAFIHILRKKDENGLDKRMVWQIPCATELQEAGVKFKKRNQSDDLTKITFHFHSGTLFIPTLCLTYGIKHVLMNLVALEQCMSSQHPRHFSTYMLFMDYLVNTAHDVKILQRNGILQSMLSSEEEVALFFNLSWANVAIPPNHNLAELFMRVNKYCDSRYHRYRARLCRDYFNSPWSIIALIAATFLLCLTIIQTFMSLYS